jgi:hypothetical protein
MKRVPGESTLRTLNTRTWPPLGMFTVLWPEKQE